MVRSKFSRVSVSVSVRATCFVSYLFVCFCAPMTLIGLGVFSNREGMSGGTLPPLTRAQDRIVSVIVVIVVVIAVVTAIVIIIIIVIVVVPSGKRANVSELRPVLLPR